MDTLDRVPFKLGDKFSKSGGDSQTRNVNRSLMEIGNRLEQYHYDFKVENSVLNAQWD